MKVCGIKNFLHYLLSMKNNILMIQPNASYIHRNLTEIVYEKKTTISELNQIKFYNS